jgi:hypothetical protein
MENNPVLEPATELVHLGLKSLRYRRFLALPLRPTYWQAHLVVFALRRSMLSVHSDVQ